MRNLDNFIQAVESSKSWNWMGYICPKNILLTKTLYNEDLSNITFNYLCENSPNSIYHFWNHKSFFTTQLVCIILAQTLWNSSNFLCHFSNKKWVFLQSLDHSSVSWEITLLRFFSWNFIYAIDKSSTSKCKFSDFPLLALKFTKFIMSFLKTRARFSSNFASLSTLMRDNSSVLFHLKLYMLSTKGTHQVQIFSQLLALKLTKFLVIFQATSQFSLQLRLDKKSPWKYKFSNFWVL